MANDPGAWYEQRRLEAERLGHELAGACAVRNAMMGSTYTSREMLLETAHEVVRRLTRQLEAARYVGD